LLPAEVLKQFTGRLGDYGVDGFIGTFYNGAGQWRITEVTLRIVQAKDGPKAPGVARDYRLSTAVEPLATGTVSFSPLVDPKLPWDWYIVSARGIPIELSPR